MIKWLQENQNISPEEDNYDRYELERLRKKQRRTKEY